VNILIIVIYFLSGIYIGISLIKRNKKNNIVGCYSGITFGIILYYCFIPTISLIFIKKISVQYPDIEQFIGSKNVLEMIFPIILILMGFFLYNCAYNQANKRSTLNNSEYNSGKIRKISSMVGFFSLIIGGISLVIFIRAFGGVKQAFSYAETVRSFNTNLSDYVQGNIAILIIPARLVTVSPFAFFILLNEKETKNKVIYRIFFAVSLVLAIIYFIFNAGRAPLLCFLLSFALVYIYKVKKKPWKFIVVLAIVSLPILDVLDSFSLYLQSGNWRTSSSNYINYIYQFIHPFKNIVNMVNIVDIYGMRYGKDFVTAILGMIPGINFPTSYENTSIFFNGKDWRMVGGTPNDLVTFGYIEFGIVGVFLIFIILGYFSGVIDKIIKNMPDGDIKNFISTTMMIQILTIIPNADFISIVRGGFILIFISIIILNSYKRRK